MFPELFDKTKTKVTLLGPQEFPSVLLESVTSPVLFVDGGTRWQSSLKPECGRGLAIGDGDSSSIQMDILLPKNKDYSDFQYVLKNIPPQYTSILALGFLGGRRDHEYTNFGEAYHFMKLRAQKSHFTFDHEVYLFSAGEWSLYIDGRFSYVNFEACDLRMTGLCEYQIKDDKKIPPMTSLGLSNWAQGEVQIYSSLPFFIFPEKVIRF